MLPVSADQATPRVGELSLTVRAINAERNAANCTDHNLSDGASSVKKETARKRKSSRKAATHSSDLVNAVPDTDEIQIVEDEASSGLSATADRPKTITDGPVPKKKETEKVTIKPQEMHSPKKQRATEGMFVFYFTRYI